jgi:hypothetical protein
MALPLTPWFVALPLTPWFDPHYRKGDYVLQPLWFFLWQKGFSDDFNERALKPMLTPLFVTAHGSTVQSAGATLSYFHDGSFLSFSA